MALTPKCMFTYYQEALNRIFKKAESKLRREMEVHTLLRRVRNHDKLINSFEKFEVFNGLKKHYKYDYVNTLQASIDTE